MSARTCLHCKKLPAEKLTRLGKHDAYFCSMTCAAAWALEVVDECSMYQWCYKHGEWTDCGDTVCAKCAAEVAVKPAKKLR